MEKKFETIANSYILNNLSAFRSDIMNLSKHNLLRFLIWCKEKDNGIDIFIVEKYISPY